MPPGRVALAEGSSEQPPAASPTPRAMAQVLTGRLVLDGDMADWPAPVPGSEVRLERAEQVLSRMKEAWKGPQDASAVVRLACDADTLYLGAEVRDDRLTHPGEPWWHGDTIELFFNTALVPGESPPTSFTEACWQVFLMPMNPQLGWGVAYRGQRFLASDGGFRGVRLAHQLRADGAGYTLEFALPLANLGIEGTDARALGFSLALSDADEEPARQKAYLSWDGSGELYQRPDRFGLLDLPVRNPSEAGAGPYGTPGGPPAAVLAVLLALLVAVLLAGPGARALVKVGPQPKAWMLGLTGLLALVLAQRGEAQAARGLEDLARALDRAEAGVRLVAREAAALGSLDEPDPARRAALLQRLLAGERIPCTPRLDDVALVPLLPPDQPPARAGEGYSIPLERGLTFHLLAPLDALELVARTRVEAAPERREGVRALGTLQVEGVNGQRADVVLEAPGGAAADNPSATRLTLQGGGPWTSLTFTPLPGAPRAVLVGLEARDAQGRTQAVPLSGTSEDGIPILAHARGPQFARSVEPGESATVELPEVRGADRLWVVLTAQRAYPALSTPETLARLTVTYAEGEPTQREVTNGLDLVAERLPAGLAVPGGLRSRVAYRWTDAGGVSRVHHLLPVRLDPRSRALSLTLTNLGPGERLTLLAATVARTAVPAADGPLAITSLEDDTERVVLRAEPTAWRDFLARGGEAPVRRTLEVASGERSTRVVLASDVLPATADARSRTSTALLTCLAIGALLCVLLVVDLLDRSRRLAWRLALGVIAAALLPLAGVIVLVDRSLTARAESEQTARARAALETAESALKAAQRRAQDVVRQLAGELAGDVWRSEGARLERFVRVYLAGALPEGRAGVALATGADLPLTRVATTGPGRTLWGAGFVAERSDEPGFLLSPWDGLLVVASSRAGRAGQWARVTLGLRVDEGLLAAEVQSGLPDPDMSLALLSEDGARLAVVGPTGEALASAVAADRSEVRTLLEAAPTAVLARLPRARGGDPEHVAVVRALAPGAWLALGVDRARVDEAVRGERERVLWLGLFALVLVVLAASLLARRVADPIRGLVRVTEDVRRGDFSTPAEPSSSDEVGELTLAFDQMRVDLKARIEDLDVLRRAQDALAATLDLGQRARVVLDLFSERFAPVAGAVLGVTGSRGPLQVLAERGRATTFADRPFAPADAGWLRAALDARTPLVMTAPDDPRRAAEGLPGRRLVEDRAAWMAVPLRSGEELQGLVVLAFDDAARVPVGEAARLVAPLAAVAAVAFNSARLYRLAALDDVSRLPGATSFEAGLKGDVERALQGGPEVWLLRVGLDHLDHVTLRRGVEAAHDLVRAAADALRAVTPGRPILGRLREDELAVRLPGQRRDEALALAETVRARIAALEVPPEAGGEPVTTTASVGVARAPGDAKSVEFLLHAAERALLKARSDGGDRVECADAMEAGLVELPPFEEGAIFRNEKMVRVVEAARRAARSDASVLITGETGTGKEVIASLIHRRSLRADRPFVSVNCAAFPETLLESELFGYERGAFTGAERRREGRFEMADRGTLFLDEVGEMSLAAQVKLLRVLQERQFTRLGSNRPINADVRILAATNKDLEQAVRTGAFREDLYYRLNVIRLEVPPLRQRREEIPALVEHFLGELRRRQGRGPEGFTPAAMDVLYRHPWPGNVRELKNLVERCAVLCEAPFVGPEHLQLDAGRGEGAGSPPPRGAPRDDLSERQKRLLDHLALHGRCTNREYQELSGTSARTGLRDLQDLIDRGLIVRDGKRRGAVYRLA